MIKGWGDMLMELFRRRGINLGRCSEEFKPQSTQRAQREPVVNASENKKGVGPIRQGNDYVSKQGLQKHIGWINTSLEILGIARSHLKKSLNQLISGFSFPLCSLLLKISGLQLSKVNSLRQQYLIHSYVRPTERVIDTQGPQKHTSYGWLKKSVLQFTVVAALISGSYVYAEDDVLKEIQKIKESNEKAVKVKVDDAVKKFKEKQTEKDKQEAEIDSKLNEVKDYLEKTNEQDAAYGVIEEENVKSLEEVIEDQQNQVQEIADRNKRENQKIEGQLMIIEDDIVRNESLKEKLDSMIRDSIHQRIKLHKSNRAVTEKRMLLEKEAAIEKEKLKKLKATVEASNKAIAKKIDTARQKEILSRKQLNDKLSQAVSEIPKFKKEAQEIILAQKRNNDLLQQKINTISNRYKVSLEHNTKMLQLVSGQLNGIYSRIDANTDAIKLGKKFQEYLLRTGKYKNRTESNYIKTLDTLDTLLADRDNKRAELLGKVEGDVKAYASKENLERKRLEKIVTKQNQELQDLKSGKKKMAKDRKWILDDGLNNSFEEGF